MNNLKPTLLEIDNLHIHFYTDLGVIKAVNGLSLRVAKGQSIGIVGESGCGKSVTAAAILGLIRFPPGKILDGSINYKGQNVNSLTPKQKQQIRGKEIALIFQDALTALNPVFSIGDQLCEAIYTHYDISHKQCREKVLDLLNEVGLPHPADQFKRYPHELSGGMCQRVMIAMALSCEPMLLIADEPTTALDVTVQAQILRLLTSMKEKRNLSLLFISHDLAIVSQITDRIAVVYAGTIIEEGPTDCVLAKPLHPYTQGLLKALPSTQTIRNNRLYTIRGAIPHGEVLPTGCAFAPRCDLAQPRCEEIMPAMITLDSEKSVRCLLYE